MSTLQTGAFTDTMANGTRFKMNENQLTQLSDTINMQVQAQISQLIETVTSYSSAIVDFASTLQRMESLLQSLATNAVTHGPACDAQPF